MQHGQLKNTTIVTSDSLKTFIYQGDYKSAYFVGESKDADGQSHPSAKK
jgi:hypothetical protein